MSEERKMNLYQKMLAITDELKTVAKNLDVQTGKNKSYKAVSERDIIDAVKPLEAKYGIYSFPVSRNILEAKMLETDTDYGKKTTFFTRIETRYRFVDVDNPTDFLETTTFAEGIDAQDKGSGKAMTYADKYALMKAYKISTGDDPDEKPSEEVRYEPYPTNPVPQTVEPETPRQKLIAILKLKGMDISAYAAEKGLNKETTDERYNQLIAELNGVPVVK